MEARVIEPEDWIETEFGATDLGDARRTQRLLTLMGQVAARPGASLPEACGSRGQLKAAYRFLANEAIEPAALWASHIAATYARAAGVPVVLAVQDTTELDWGPQSATAGLGPLGAPSHQGLLVHTTLAFTPERVPLGVVAQAVWARDPGTVGQRETRRLGSAGGAPRAVFVGHGECAASGRHADRPRAPPRGAGAPPGHPEPALWAGDPASAPPSAGRQAARRHSLGGVCGGRAPARGRRAAGMVAAYH